jgi:hypothetical protein
MVSYVLCPEIEMPTTLEFNKAASELLQGREGGKLRMEVRDGVMFVRPTDRKAGPHVLAEYKEGSRGGINVDIEDKQVEKLAHQFENKSQFNVVPDKYGWFALRSGDEAEGGATVNIKMTKGSSDDSDSE